MGRKTQAPVTRLVGLPQKSRAGAKPRETREVPLTAFEDIFTRAASGPLSEADITCLKSVVNTLAMVTSELEHSRSSVKRLQQMMFGMSTESLKNIRKNLGLTDEKRSEANSGQGDCEQNSEPTEKPKRKGHGRRSASEYTGAKRERVTHTARKSGDPCECCGRGKLYPYNPANQFVRVVAIAPIQATVYEQEVLRCNQCGVRREAPLPEGVEPVKYDASVAAMVVTYRYGAGVPFARLETLCAGWGIPLPQTTQWMLVSQALSGVEPVYEALRGTAANAELFHQDDTGMRVLEPDTLELPPGTKPGERTGLYTTGILAQVEGRKVALFMTGLKHAGENLSELLTRRQEWLAPPLQMCDGLAANLKGSMKTLVCNCLAHGRRQIVEVVRQFPDEALHILELLAEVYHNDDEARKQQLSKEARLSYHQTKSQPLMETLHTYMSGLLEQKQVEPNSTLGSALRYNLKHWSKMTQFLRVAGAPLDNSEAERLLKKAIRHRRNSLFYKTGAGAHAGDVYMSLLYTAEMNGANPFQYLLALMTHPNEVSASPEQWYPWNYRETLTHLTAAA